MCNNMVSRPDSYSAVRRSRRSYESRSIAQGCVAGSRPGSPRPGPATPGIYPVQLADMAPAGELRRKAPKVEGALGPVKPRIRASPQRALRIGVVRAQSPLQPASEATIRGSSSWTPVLAQGAAHHCPGTRRLLYQLGKTEVQGPQGDPVEEQAEHWPTRR